MIKKLSLLFFFSAYFSICISQDDTTKKVFYYDSGRISSEGMMYQGKPVGYWKAFYESGLLKSEGNRLNNELQGPWKFYNENGDLKKEINYEKGLKQGLTFIYDDSCNLVRIENYEADVLDGKVREYYQADTMVRWVIPFNQGIRDGYAFEYAKDGRIITIIDYNNGFVKKKEEINRRNKLGKQGTWREFFNDGSLHTESRYKNDVLHGYYKEYDRDGKLVAAILYLDGIIQENPEELSNLEVRREYYEDGTVKSEGTYNYQGEKEGTFKSYDEKGNLIIANVFSKDVLLAKGKLNKEGQRIEEWEFYYPDSSLRAKGEYKEGLRIGKWIFYHNNGKVEQKGKYVKDEKPHGDWVWYYSNGQIWREEGFWKGREDGEAIEYDESGEVISKGQYIDGKKDGIWFYELNDHKEEGNYVEGNKDGEWVHTFLENGKVSFKGKFINGDPDGKHVYFYPNGKIKREEYYELGYEEGTWRSYDEEGNLMLTSQWEGGKEVKLDKRKVK